MTKGERRMGYKPQVEKQDRAFKNSMNKTR
jgi:hypothetical protein